MKSHKPSKLIALGLALTMGLSIPAALAASSLVPASTKVTVAPSSKRFIAFSIHELRE